MSEVMNLVLFASKNLDAVWLTDIWDSPCLINGVWHWRCDLTFLSWVDGVIERAGAKMPSELRDKADRLRCEIYIANGITPDTLNLVPAPGAALPRPEPDPLALYDCYAFSWHRFLYTMAVDQDRPRLGAGAKVPARDDDAPYPETVMRTVSRHRPDPDDMPERVAPTRTVVMKSQSE